MGVLTEFKEFAMRGNVIDLAVGVVIGGAFGKIVTSMVDDIIMPLVGSIFGNLDFTNLYVALGQVPEGTAPTLAARMACALGYSGCSGASISEVQAGSRAVASLPSMSPLRIALTGRQNW